MPVTPVPSTDTPNAGRVKWNDNDITLQTAQESIAADLNEHKISSDHDGRYYTETEVDTFFNSLQTAQENIAADLNAHKVSSDHDGRYYTQTEVNTLFNNHAASTDHAQYVKKTGNETVAGEKTFSNNIKISKETSAAQLQLDSVVLSDRREMRLAHYHYGDYHAAAIEINVGTPSIPDWKYIMFVRSNDTKVLFSNHEVYSLGKKLASEDYVQERIKSGQFVLRSFRTADINGTSTIDFAEGKRFLIPRSCTLKKISLSRIDEEGGNCKVYDWNTIYTFQPDKIQSGYATGKRYLRPQINISEFAGVHFLELYLFAGRINNSGVYSEEQIFFSNIQQNDGFAQGTFDFDLTLLLSL
jgi:hypothetical protein